MRVGRRGVAALVAALAVLAVVAPAPAQAWDADPGYGTDGKVATKQVDIYTDGAGRLVVVQRGPSYWTTTEVVRYTADGTLDPTFGTAGTATVTWPAAIRDTDVTVRSDGSVGLWTVPKDGAPGVLLGAQLDSAGQPVAGFGTDGVTSITCCASTEDLPRTDLGDAVLLDDGTSRLTVVRLRQPTVTLLAREVRMVSVDAQGAVTGEVLLSDQLDDRNYFRMAPAGEGRVLLATESSTNRGVRSTHVARWTAALTQDPGYGTGGERVLKGGLERVVASGNRAWVATKSTANGFYDVAALGPDGLAVPGFGTAGSVRWGRASFSNDWGVTGIWDLVPTPGGGVVVGGIRTTCLKVSWACDEWAFGAKVQQIAPDGSFGAAAPIDQRDGRLTGVALASGGSAVLVGQVEGTTPAVRRYVLDDHLTARLAPFASSAAVAEELAQDFLGRPATTAEIQGVTAQINEGTSVPFLFRAAADQPAWATKHDPVVRLYRAYFGRIPDIGGLRYWMGRRAQGVTVARISASFADSSEFRRQYGSLSDRAFVELVYRNVLGRNGDPSGIDYWTRRIEAGRTSRGQVMASMSESAEHVRKREPEVRTVALFTALLDRVPTSAELEAWAGPEPIGDEDALVRLLLSSPEFVPGA